MGAENKVVTCAEAFCCQERLAAYVVKLYKLQSNWFGHGQPALFSQTVGDVNMPPGAQQIP